MPLRSGPEHKKGLVHGCALILGCQGLLIQGPSGSGKTTTARRLIEEFQSLQKFSRWVADDQVELLIYPQAVLASVPRTIAGLAERRYCGIEKIPFEHATRLDLIIDLVPQEQLERLPETKTVRLHKSSKPLPLIKVPQKQADLAIEIVRGHLPTA